MNFEELSEIWKSQNENEAKIEINKKIFLALSLNSVKNKLREVKWSSIIEVAINYIWAIFLVGFIINNFSEFKFSLPGIILFLIAVYSIVIETYKLVLYHSINHHQSILKAQHKLEKLNYLEKFDINSLYFFIPIFFIPFIIVATKGFLGIDIYDLGFSEREMISCFLGSFVVSVVVVFFLRKYPNKEMREALEYLRELKDMV